MNLTPQQLVAAEFPELAHLPLTNPAFGRPPVPGLYLRKPLHHWIWAVWTGHTWRAGATALGAALDPRRGPSGTSPDGGVWVGLVVDPQRDPQREKLLAEAVSHLRNVVSTHIPSWEVFFAQRQAAREWLHNLPADLA